MADSLKILFLSAEVAPFAKTGGLGDIGGSLPKALADLGHDVRVVMPAYKVIEDGYPGVEPGLEILRVPMGTGVRLCGTFEGKLPDSEVPISFIADWQLFKRDTLYGYWDDVYRFAFFSRAALELTVAWDWKPDIVHAHDWHTAPALTWLATAGQIDERFRGISTVFTIHNLAHQGKSDWDIFDQLGIQTFSLNEEAYSEVNFMARGIYHATMVNTVSPSYAREITTVEGGSGLDVLLRHREYDLHGILNGLDYDSWNPATDSRLPYHFSADLKGERWKNRQALQAYVNLPQRDDVPIVAMVSRLDWQKGLDIMGHTLHQLMNGYAGDAQFIVLGTGEAGYEQMFADIASYHPGKLAAILSYDAGLAPLIYAGSDMFVMPSLFEPCGLGQMIAMRYGSVPVVRGTGGLKDTVEDTVNGFVFYDYNWQSFWEALERAIYYYNDDHDRWQQIQHNGMMADFSWSKSAAGYQQLYEWALARTRGA